MAAKPRTDSMASRMGRLESDVEHIGQDMVKLTDVVASGQAATKRGFESLENKLDEKTKPPDQRYLLGFAGGLLVIVFSMTQCQQAKAVDDADKQGTMNAHIAALRADLSELSTWARETQRTRFSEGDARRLDDALQREMRDLDKVSKVRLDNLDTVLQREMDLKIAPVRAMVESNAKHLKGRDGNRWNRDMMSDWQRDVYHRDLDETRRTMSVEIRSLQAEIDRLRAKVDSHQSDGHHAIVKELKERLRVVEAEQRRRTAKVYKDP